MTRLLRQLITEIVRGYVDPDWDLDYSQNKKYWRQFETMPDFIPYEDPESYDEARPGQSSVPEPELEGEDCMYCVGSGMRDVGDRTVKCDVCGGSGKIF